MKKTINVVHLISGRSDNIYGGDIVALNILKHLDKRNFKSHLLSFKESRLEGEPLVVKKARSFDIEAGCIYSRGKFDYRSIFELKAFVNKNNIDIIHSHGYKADIFSWFLKGLSIKQVSTLHGWWLGNSPKLKFYNYLDMLSIRNFDRIVTVSNEVKSRLIRYVNSERITVINNGVDLDEISVVAKIDLGMEADNLLLAIVGRLSKEKGHKYLFEAISDIDSLKLLVIGTGPLEEKLKRYVIDKKIEKKVLFCGFKNNVLEYMNSVDIFILPSISEGLPLSLLEAMALKKAVVASDVGEIPNVIQDKDNGLLVEAKNVASLTNAIKYLQNNHGIIENMGQKAYETVKDRYSVLEMVSKYQDVYKEIMNGQ
jgi:glycosyltransferase involved in cell wall biosynthesis